MAGWLDNYGKEENPNNSKLKGTPGLVGLGTSNKGRNYSPAWGGQFKTGGKLPTGGLSRGSDYGSKSKPYPSVSKGDFAGGGRSYPIPTKEDAGDALRLASLHGRADVKAKVYAKYPELKKDEMGGSIPGTVGFTYAREGAPSNGKYAKKTLPSAQNGKKLPSVKELIEETKKRKTQTRAKEQPKREKETTKTPKPTVHRESDLTPTQKARYAQQKRIETHGDIRAAEEQPFMDRALAIATNPLTAFGYSARGERLPEHFERGERNTLDAPLDIINPAAIGKSLYDMPGQLSRGDFSGAALGALDVIPALGEAAPYLRRMKTSISPELRQGLRMQGFSPSGKPILSFNPVAKRTGVNTMGNTMMYGDEAIGDVDLFRDQGNWVMDNIGMDEAYRGKGLGKEAYRIANKNIPAGEGPLHSSGYFEGDDAKRVWESLVRSGEAEQIGEEEWRFLQKKQGGVIKDNRGQWAYPGEITEINSNDITMKGVPYDVIGISDTGDTKHMKPGKDYKFKGKKVTEYPMAKDGKELQKLDQLTNFTNYNKPQPGGWLDKYQ